MSSQHKALSTAISLPNIPLADIDDPAQLVVLGKVGSSYGLQGWLKIQSYTYPLDNVLDYKHCYVGKDKQWREFELTEGRLHGKGVVAHFKGFDSPEIAKQLTNLFIAIPRNALPDTNKDEYYWHDLIGLDVINLVGKRLGTIQEFFDSGPHDIMVIRDEKEEFLIPFVRDVFVKAIDLQAKTVTVDWQPESFTYK